MLKYILLVLGGVVVVLLFICGGVLFWAQRAGAARQEQFFAAVTSGKASEVLALCDPAMLDEIDEPILTAWLAEVRKNLGEYRGLSATDFNTSSRIESGQRITQSSGTVEFAHGTAHSELVYRNDLIVRFEIKSDKIPDHWFQGPQETSLYRDRTKAFFTAFLNSDTDQATALMHEKLREAVPREQLQAMTKQITDLAGAWKAFGEASDTFSTDEGEKLTVKLRIQCERAELDADAEFRFAGLKGHLTAFHAKPASK